MEQDFQDRKRGMILLPALYLAPVGYYRQMNISNGRIIIDSYDCYVRQTYHNRCVIAGANGLQTLTVPVVKPSSTKTAVKDIRISEHGNWRHIHWNAIISAYNSSPFLEYYADDFRPFYEKKQTFLLDFNEALRETVCNLLDISPEITYSVEYMKASDENITDLREIFKTGKKIVEENYSPYYQVFACRHGFQPNLSIIDLLFNMGPEAYNYLL
jgi:hypothetical protein